MLLTNPSQSTTRDLAIAASGFPVLKSAAEFENCFAQYKKIEPRPTEETYGSLNQAFHHFNNYLFDGRLRDCLLTLQRKKRSLGYFSPARFVNGQNQRADELALNPQYFKGSGIVDVMSTLVHEMCHLEQAQFGDPGSGRYHNKEWASMMKRVGLQPSSTGRIGGKETGQRMSDYPIAGGLFLQATEALTSMGFMLDWVEDVGNVVADQGDDAEMTPDDSAPDRSLRRKFTCPNCQAKAWGKPTLLLICGHCTLPLVTGRF